MAGSVNKVCECCGFPFLRHHKDSQKQWEGRKYCSKSCSNKSVGFTPLHVTFWNNVEVLEGNNCWIWQGSLDAYGYGKISSGGRSHKRDIRAHRLSYEMRFGLIKDGNVICHTCDNPSCVNPNHLFEGTQKDNVRDMVRKGRMSEISKLNLRPGEKGTLGAGSKSKKEIQNA